VTVRIACTGAAHRKRRRQRTAMSETPGEDDFPPPSEAMRELGELITTGLYRVLDHTPDATFVCIRAHDDGSVDTIGIRHEDDVMVQRTNPLGFTVWEMESVTLATALKGLRELPAPDQPGAPTLKLPQSRRPLDSEM
jgi:hypothetical protein